MCSKYPNIEPFVFPKPVSENVIETLTDESGFTEIEKVTLHNAWRVINRRFERHAEDIFLKFFVDNATILERFRGSNGKFHMGSLHQHPQSVLKIYERIIEEGLDNKGTFNVIMNEVLNWHREYKISIEEISLMTEAVRLHLQQVLEKISSPTLILALQKLSATITDYHNEDKVSPINPDNEENNDEDGT